MPIGLWGQSKKNSSYGDQRNTSIGVEIACDKEDTKYLLEQAEVEVPKGDIISRESSLKEACRLCRVSFSDKTY